MKYATLGIIGHVDHGKTSLVKALTGVDTDRLEEEKRRGISIVLGYSHLEVPSGEFGLIDAPGHEKFIKTMVAGAAGSEAVLLVVDVNEGVKPQTIEHLNIAQLLGIGAGVVAITKCDTADAEMQELAEAEVEELVEGTFLEGAPVVRTSSVSGDGLDELIGILDGVLQSVEPLKDEGLFYLPVDRVFTMAGHGTVVTGTLRRGSLGVDDRVEVYPQGIEASVREMQTHSATVERVAAGRRTAVNLRGLEKAELAAGDVVASAGSLRLTRFLDVELRLLSDAEKALTHNQIVRLLFGTKESYARVHFLDRTELAPGDLCYGQLKLEEGLAPLNLEPFIIRSYSPMTTIGGGRILAANDGRYKRNRQGDVEFLRTLAQGTPEDILDAVLRAAGRTPLSLDRFCVDRRVSKSSLKKLVQTESVVTIGDGLAVHGDVFEAFGGELESTLSEFHENNGTLRGMPQRELAQALGVDAESPLFAKGLEQGRKAGTLGTEKGSVFLAAFNPEGAMSAADKAVLAELESAFTAGGMTPPMVADVVGGDARREKLYRYLVDRGVLIPLTAPSRNKNTKNNMAFHRDAVSSAIESLRNAHGAGVFSTAQAKEDLGISRKFLIPLLEYLDSIGATRRTGEERVLN